MIVVVRPWKLPVQTMISAWSAGIPFDSYPQRRAALTAVSTASAPVFIGNAMSCPVSSQASFRKGPSLSV